MKTIKFELTTGINAGYGHNNEEREASLIVGELYQQVAEKMFDQTGVYVSAVIRDTKTLYSTSWGCPFAGEITITISGVANPLFCSDMEQYKETVLLIAKELKTLLSQSTVAVEFYEVSDFVYLAD